MRRSGTAALQLYGDRVSLWLAERMKKLARHCPKPRPSLRPAGTGLALKPLQGAPLDQNGDR